MDTRVTLVTLKCPIAASVDSTGLVEEHQQKNHRANQHSGLSSASWV